MLSSEENKINQLIWKVFTKGHGLTLQVDAVEFLKQKVTTNFPNEETLLSALQYVASTYKKQSQRPTLVDADSLAKVIEGLLKVPNVPGQQSAPAKDFVFITNSWNSPKWDYDPHMKKFYLKEDSYSSLGDVDAKGKALRRHFEIIKQRILRQPEFSGANGVKVCSIKSVKGIRSNEIKCLFGMLSCMAEGETWLEDPDDCVKLDLDQIVTVMPSFYTEYSFVIIMGYARGDHFEATFIGAPPMENRTSSLVAPSVPNYAASSQFADALMQVKEYEPSYVNASLVVLSEVWLDCARTMNKFEDMLKGFQEMLQPPSAIILLGSLMKSIPSLSTLRNAFGNLATMILKYSKVVSSCKLIFIPSPDDLLSTGTLPRPALPTDLLSPFQYHGMDAEMCSNPCRVFFFTRELLVLRDDMTVNYKKNLIGNSKLDSAAEGASTMRSILDQAHLNPFPPSASTRLWDLDHSLTVYPAPDILIVGEKSTPASSREEGCLCINPGSFSTCEYSFVTIYPFLDRLDPCKV